MNLPSPSFPSFCKACLPCWFNQPWPWGLNGLIGAVTLAVEVPGWHDELEVLRNSGATTTLHAALVWAVIRGRTRVVFVGRTQPDTQLALKSIAGAIQLQPALTAQHPCLIGPELWRDTLAFPGAAVIRFAAEEGLHEIVMPDGTGNSGPPDLILADHVTTGSFARLAFWNRAASIVATRSVEPIALPANLQRTPE